MKLTLTALFVVSIYAALLTGYLYHDYGTLNSMAVLVEGKPG